MKKLVIVPTYNESDVIAELLEKIFQVCADVNVLVVDDNSPDGTGDVVDRLAGSDHRVRCLHRPEKRGLGPAYLAGFRWAIDAGYDYILQMDADFSHDPGRLPHLFALAERCDLVIGSRYIAGGGIRNWGPTRRLVSRGASWYARTMLGVPLRDFTSGFMCWKRGALERVGLDGVPSKGYGFLIEMKYKAHRTGATIVESPITFTDRRAGKSKMSLAIAFEAALIVFRLKFGATRTGG